MHTHLDMACITLQQSRGSESDILEYYRALTQTTFYVPIIDTTEKISLLHPTKNLSLYAKTLTKSNTQEKVILAFDTYERYQQATKELFDEDENYTYIALPGQEIVQQINLHYGLNINFSISDYNVVFTKEDLQWLNSLPLENIPSSFETNFDNFETEKLNVLYQELPRLNYVKSNDIINNLNDLEIRDIKKDGFTLLIQAALLGFLPIVKLLIEKGADISARDDLLRTALHHAAMEGYPNTVEYLLEKNCDMNLYDTWGYQALHYAAKNSHNKIVRILFEAGANLHTSVKDPWGNPPLHLAVRTGAIRVVKTLLELGADINQQQNYHWSALHQAVDAAHPRIVHLLVENGININLINDYGVTALEQGERSLIEGPGRFPEQRKAIVDYLRHTLRNQ